MSNLNLQIGGRTYAVACAEGEEAHVSALGQMIADKVDGIGAGHSEARHLLFAALILADELHEARQRGGAPVSAMTDDRQAELLEAVAERLEKVATALEG